MLLITMTILLLLVLVLLILFDIYMSVKLPWSHQLNFNLIKLKKSRGSCHYAVL